MKKLLTYLTLLICCESFISATPVFCDKQKIASDLINKNIFPGKKAIQEDINLDFHPLNIFCFRIN